MQSVFRLHSHVCLLKFNSLCWNVEFLNSQTEDISPRLVFGSHDFIPHVQRNSSSFVGQVLLERRHSYAIYGSALLGPLKGCDSTTNKLVSHSIRQKCNSYKMNAVQWLLYESIMVMTWENFRVPFCEGLCNFHYILQSVP